MPQEKESKPSPELILSSAPHIKADQSVKAIMWTVVLALSPAAAFAVHLYGIHSLVLMLASMATAACTEALYQSLMKKTVTVTDGSAAITGLLLAMNVPPGVPVWMVCVGAAFAIIIAKQVFGGVGFNIFNPALAGRAFLMASWPAHMTTQWHRFSPLNILSRDITNAAGLPAAAFDVVTQATPLGALKEVPALLSDMNVPAESLYRVLFSKEMMKSLFVGNIGGCIGETSAMLLLLGAALLLARRIITWHIPAAYIGTVAVFTGLYYGLTGFPYPFEAVIFHLLSGGLVLGAFFMATDMVTSPVTKQGMLLFGAGCGILTCVIRLWGGYPEGVSYSILLMNTTVPLIDRYLKPKVFGTKHL